MSVLGQISTGTGHLIPNPERAYSEQPVVNRSEQVLAETEQIQHEAVDREKSLCVRSGFEPTHLSFALSRRLMRGLSAIVRVLVRDVNDRRHHGPAGRRVAPKLVGDQPAGNTALAL